MAYAISPVKRSKKFGACRSICARWRSTIWDWCRRFVWYVQQCAERHPIEIKFTVAESLQRLPADLEIILYRAVQEGLTNIMRHAQARHADISLEQSGNVVWLTIVDDGKGIQPGRIIAAEWDWKGCANA